MSNADFMAAEAGMSRSPGTCMTMGTASTLACIFEAMGLSLPFNGTIPGVDARRKAMAHRTGNRIVELVDAGATIGDVLTREAFENGVKMCAAIGGSTNAVLHLLALAGRAGVEFDLADWQHLGASVPLIVDLMPSGKYLMEDFHYAGGVPAVIAELGDRLNLDHVGVSGLSLREIAATARNDNPHVIRPVADPLMAEGGLVILKGNLAPRGAVIKPGAATAELLQHRGRAVVLRLDRGLPRARRRPRPRHRCVAASWSSRAAARAAIRGCPRSATCRCRASCSKRACATWSASPTRG